MKRVVAFVGVVSALLLTGFAGAGGRTPPRAPRHISLLIGIGNYKHADDSAWRAMRLRNLKGPANDVVRMRTVLRNRGFDSGPDQRVLIDRDGRKEKIQEAFSWLASRATNSSDVVVIYYSGHGSWAPDRDIDRVRTKDEATIADPGDVWDEALVPWDAAIPSDPKQLVLDDELGAWLDRLGTRNVTVIVDACFSGTVTRGDPDTSSATAPVDRGPRPPDRGPRAPKIVALSNGMLEGGGRLNHTLITAAAAWQKAQENRKTAGDVVSGVFTRALVEALEGAGPSTRLDDLIRQVGVIVGSNQTPQLEGDGGGRVFRVGASAVIPARGYALVRPAGRGRVRLDVGAIHGVRNGAVYDVFPAGETSFSGRGLAQVTIDSVLEATSFAEIVSPSPSIPPGARATLSRMPPGVMTLDRLALYVHPNASTLRDSLASYPWLRLTSRASATAEIRRRGEGYQVLVGGHDVPPLWGDIDGDRTVPGGAGSTNAFKGSLSILCQPLRRAYSIAAMNVIRNDQPPPLERLQLDIRVLPDSVAEPTRTQASVDTVYIGERYNVYAWVQVPRAARQRSVLYLTAALTGYAASPRVLWPEAGAVTSSLSSGALNMPILLQSGFRFQSVADFEIIKAVVSSNPYDLRPLVGGFPQCPSGGRDRTRGPPGTDPLVVTGWTAVERRVEIMAR